MKSGQRTRRREVVTGIGSGAVIICAAAIWAVQTMAAPVDSTATYASGDLDPTYGSGGVAQAFVGSPNGVRVNDAVQTPDGKLVAAGSNASGAFAVARFTGSGALDTTFGGTGQVTTTFTGGGADAWSVAVQSDGKV